MAQLSTSSTMQLIVWSHFSSDSEIPFHLTWRLCLWQSVKWHFETWSALQTWFDTCLDSLPLFVCHPHNTQCVCCLMCSLSVTHFPFSNTLTPSHCMESNTCFKSSPNFASCNIALLRLNRGSYRIPIYIRGCLMKSRCTWCSQKLSHAISLGRRVNYSPSNAW